MSRTNDAGDSASSHKSQALMPAKAARLAAVAALAGLAGCAPSDTAILEIAVYRVHSPTEYISIRAETRKRLASEPGFLWWHPLKAAPGVEEAHGSGQPELLFADVLAWESIEAARAAAEKVESNPAYRPFVSAISDIRHFTHYRAYKDAANLERVLRDSRIIEIAAYSVHDPDAFTPTHTLLYESKLPGREGLVGGTRMRRLFDADHKQAEDGFGDLLGWESIQAWQDTGAAMMADPELKPFFEGIDESKVFAVFIKDPGPNEGAVSAVESQISGVTPK